jgi:hypothetical protein
LQISTAFYNSATFYLFCLANTSLCEFHIREKKKGKLIMGNPETLTTIDTQDTGRRQTKQEENTTQKTKIMSNTDPAKQKQGVNPCARYG